MCAIARQRVESENDAQLAQRLAGAPRQVEARRVGAIDDVDVVVAWDQGKPPAQLLAIAQQIDKRRPFGARAGIGDVAGQQDAIERRAFVNGAELAQGIAQRPVAARTLGPGLHPIPVALADDVKVG